MREILISALLYFQQACCKKYYSYTLYECIPADENQFSFINNLTKKFDVQFWRKPDRWNMPIDFMISPVDKSAFLKDARLHGLNLTTKMEDVQKEFDQQTVLPYIRRRTESFGWQYFYRIEDIYNWLRDLSEAHSKSMTVMSIGKTYEGRDIIAVTIYMGNWQNHPRPRVIVEGGIHAREWVSTAFVTFLIHKILSDPKFKEIAEFYEWNFVPVLNPDGYEYTHSKDRMWRKNRLKGYGVDINRNFGHEFGKVDVEKSSESFCGDAAFSESESQAMANFVRSKAANLQYYLSFHSYGQYIIIPYSYNKKHEENYDEMNFMAKRAAVKLRKLYGTAYTVGTAYDTVGYTASGSSTDWVKRTHNVPYVATFELRDNGKHGFALPPKLILPTCTETMVAVKSLLEPRAKNINKKADRLQSGGQSGQVMKLNNVIICFTLLIKITVL